MEAKVHDVVVLHGCAHNPSGIDFTEAQWDQLLELMFKKELIPLVDVAYQGFRTGDFATDGYVCRQLLKLNQPFVATQFFDKCFTMYGECCSVVYVNSLPCTHVISSYIQNTYERAAMHGQALVRVVFTKYYSQHLGELQHNC